MIPYSSKRQLIRVYSIPEFWAVVCNAGLNDGGEVLWTSMDTFQKVIDVNFLGTVRVAKAFLPMVCKSKGRVAAVASAAGEYCILFTCSAHLSCFIALKNIF